MTFGVMEGDHDSYSRCWRQCELADGSASARRSLDLPARVLAATITNTSWPYPVGAVDVTLVRWENADMILTVHHDRAEAELAAGRLSCECAGRLRPWGHARSRLIRPRDGSHAYCVRGVRSARSASGPTWCCPWHPCHGAQTPSRRSETPCSKQLLAMATGPSLGNWRFRLRRCATGCAGRAAELSGSASRRCVRATTSTSASRSPRREQRSWPRRSMRSHSPRRLRSAALGGWARRCGASSPL